MRLGCAIAQNGRRWCSTRINPLTGIHVSGQGQWGFCNSNCPNHNNSMFPSHILYPNFFMEAIFSQNVISFPDPSSSPASTRPPATTSPPVPTTASTCQTTSDSQKPNQPCVFPFQFQGVTYSGGWSEFSEIKFFLLEQLKLIETFFEIRLSKYALWNWNEEMVLN